jgi:hypothetical protein
MQTIITKYLGRTTWLSARVKATSTSGLSVTVALPPDALDPVHTHCRAAEKLAKRLGWGRMLLVGDLDGGYVFAFPPADSAYSIDGQNPTWQKGE